MSELQEALDRLQNAERSNELDVLCEVALFKPDAEWRSARANFAGTKVIFTRRDGTESTHWANDWSKNRQRTIRSILKEQASA